MEEYPMNKSTQSRGRVVPLPGMSTLALPGPVDREEQVLARPCRTGAAEITEGTAGESCAFQTDGGRNSALRTAMISAERLERSYSTVLPKTSAIKAPYSGETDAPAWGGWLQIGGRTRSVPAAGAPPHPADSSCEPAAALNWRRYIRLTGTLFQPNQSGVYRIAAEYEGQVYDLMTFPLGQMIAGRMFSGCRVVSVDPYSVLTGVPEEQIQALLRVLAHGYPHRGSRELFQSAGIAAEESEAAGRSIEATAVALALGCRERPEDCGEEVWRAAEALYRQEGDTLPGAPWMRFDLRQARPVRHGPGPLLFGPLRIRSNWRRLTRLQAPGSPGGFFIRPAVGVTEAVYPEEDFYLVLPAAAVRGEARITAQMTESAVVPLLCVLQDEKGCLAEPSPVFASSWRPAEPAELLRQEAQIFLP